MALNWSSEHIAELLGGEHRGEVVSVNGLIHDTRLMTPDALFLALKGQSQDGHDHLATARRAGAAAALVSQPMADALTQIVVPDVLEAAGRLASAWRDGLDVTVIGITGSNGKTSVKEMVAAILSAEGETLATKGNYNNEIGVPITLAQLGPEHRFAVIEMGAARQGDIRHLAKWVRPKVGILTNAGPAHLESFGSLETIVQTKGELFQSLSDDGTAIINADSPHASYWRDLAAHGHALEFGTVARADFRAEIPHDYQVGNSVSITTPQGVFDLRLRVPGRHNILNALAALAACSVVGVSMSSAVDALSQFQSVSQRLQIHRPSSDAVIIDDSYNANPASTHAALEVLCGFNGASWFVLGDMLELGEQAQSMHVEIGHEAKRMGVDRLFGLGPLAQQAAEAFGEGGASFSEQAALIQALSKPWPNPLSILVKGSRSMHMDHVVDALLKEAS